MSQTAYNTEFAVAVAGMLNDNGVDDVLTFAAETTLEAGRPVVRGTADTQCLLPSGAADEFLGVTVFQQPVEDDDLAAVLTFSVGEPVGVLQKGRIWVRVEEAVVAGDPVFWRHTTSGPLVPGGWRNDADTATAVQVAGARFLTDAAIDTLALLSLNVA